jgi:TPR repeat protein
MKRTVIAVLLAASLSAPAWADLDKGAAAYRRGDFAAAHAEFLAAARNGEARAQYSLGLLYLRGQGVGQDYSAAMRWLRKAAGQGDGEARMVLGDLHMRDLPSIRDYVKSYMWLTLALAQVRGQKRQITFKMRAVVAAKMTPAEIARAKRMVRDWKAIKP